MPDQETREAKEKYLLAKEIFDREVQRYEAIVVRARLLLAVSGILLTALLLNMEKVIVVVRTHLLSVLIFVPAAACTLFSLCRSIQAVIDSAYHDTHPDALAKMLEDEKSARFLLIHRAGEMLYQTGLTGDSNDAAKAMLRQAAYTLMWGSVFFVLFILLASVLQTPPSTC